jgi:hypothetical protein
MRHEILRKVRRSSSPVISVSVPKFVLMGEVPTTAAAPSQPT